MAEIKDMNIYYDEEIDSLIAVAFDCWVPEEQQDPDPVWRQVMPRGWWPPLVQDDDHWCTGATAPRRIQRALRRAGHTLKEEA